MDDFVQSIKFCIFFFDEGWLRSIQLGFYILCVCIYMYIYIYIYIGLARQINLC